MYGINGEIITFGSTKPPHKNNQQIKHYGVFQDAGNFEHIWIPYDHPLFRRRFAALGRESVKDATIILINNDVLTIEFATCIPILGLRIEIGCAVTYLQTRMCFKTYIQQEFSKLDFISIFAKEWGIGFTHSEVQTWPPK